MFSDFIESDGKLSFWKVQSIEKGFPTIAAACTALKGKIPKRCCMIFVDEKLLANSGLEIELDPADTGDKEVNDWHVNVVVDTSDKLQLIAKIIAENGTPKQFDQTSLEATIQNQILTGELVPTKQTFKLSSDCEILHKTAHSLFLQTQWMELKS